MIVIGIAVMQGIQYHSDNYCTKYYLPLLLFGPCLIMMIYYYTADVNNGLQLMMFL